MRAVIQRAFKADILINQTIRRSTGMGLAVFLAVKQDDTKANAEVLAKKIAALRIFCDEKGKMNLSLLDVGGEALVVSNFTLYADCSHGRRPSFFDSAPPEQAKELYEIFLKHFQSQGIKRIETGEFGADMQVEIVNQGPVTIIIDTDDLT